MFLAPKVIVILGIEGSMAFDDPASLDLRALFRDPDMFDSRSSWGAAGFQVLNRASNGKIMVACHPLVRGLLFKKYMASVSSKDQRRNYECRLEGSGHLRIFIDGHGLTRIVVPRKWIVELPREFRYQGPVLIAEQLELLGSEQTVAAYKGIDAELLRELCTVLSHFRGMDSNVNNLPFLADGRIGLVDTEHWDRGSRKSPLHHLGEHMSAESRELAKKIFRVLSASSSRPRSSRHDDNYDEDDSSSSSLS